MSFAVTVLIFCLCTLAGFLGTLLLERMARGSALVQAPNERSSHTRPTPRGGGMAIAVVALAVILWLALGGYGAGWILAGLLAVIAALGFLDDLHDISPLIRFPLQAAVVAALIWLLGPLPSIPLPAGLALGGGLLFALVLFAGLWWLNLFNFMDGIDGIAASQAIILLVAGTALAWQGAETGAGPMGWLALATAAATAGFLLRNWPPAHIFMGDVGSNSLALVILALALTSIVSGLVSYPAWIILVSVSVSDTTATLLRRVARGQKPWHAHRSHAYQQLSRQWGHQATTIGYGLLTALWALPLALLAQHWPDVGWLLAVIAYVPVLGFMLWSGAGSPIERGKLNPA